MEQGLNVSPQGVEEKGETPAGSAGEEWKNRAQRAANAGRERLVGRVRRVASAIRATGRELGEEDENLAHYANALADRVEGAGSYLQHHEPRELLQEAEKVARHRPSLFVGGAIAFGFAMARLAKGMSGGPSNQ